MTLKESIICIDNLRLHAFHGVMEQERSVGAYFAVTLRVHYNIIKAMHSDDVAHTLNYAELYDTVREQMAIPSRLLEHVAWRICQAIADRFPATTAIGLRLTKLNPPMGADCDGAGIEIHITNDRTLTWQDE